VIPWRELQALFLDAGNTLVSIDFPRMAEALAASGIRSDVPALERAEAAARPILSRWIGGEQSTEAQGTFRFYLRTVLAQLPAAADRGDPALDGLAGALARALEPHRGASDELWCRVLPGVPEALARFRALGLRLAVVSNADGSVERNLRRIGLRQHFDAVIDSAVVGHEKPDPRIFECALEALGAPRQRVAHVGDLYHADVTGARAAGLHAVLLDPYGDWDGVDCARARDLGELAGRIAQARVC